MTDKNDPLYKAVKKLMSVKNMYLGDMVYDVRDREGEGWDGPEVKKWNEAVTEIEEIMK